METSPERDGDTGMPVQFDDNFTKERLQCGATAVSPRADDVSVFRRKQPEYFDEINQRKRK
jgi:hypothetical protein